VKVKRHVVVVLSIVTALALVLAGCTAAPTPTKAAPRPTRTPTQAPTATLTSAAPVTAEKVVDEFFSWYLEAYEEDLEDGPLASEAYQESPHLSKRFVEHVDEAFDEEELDVDPILRIRDQEVPKRFVVEAVEESDDEAYVDLEFYWEENEPTFKRRVILQMTEEEEWEIDDIEVLEPTVPREVAIAFYDWYLDEYLDEETESPLVSGAYRESPYLSQTFIQYVEEEYDEENPDQDPILGSSTVPKRFTARVLDESEEEALIELDLYSGTGELLSKIHVTLERDSAEDEWLIDELELEMEQG
jgi:hypothetical protein